jgi:hypothetical protein
MTHTYVATYTVVEFANPHLVCDVCDEPVGGYRLWSDGRQGGNHPCGHDGVTSVCPSWGPVDGCVCPEHLGVARHVPPDEAVPS